MHASVLLASTFVEMQLRSSGSQPRSEASEPVTELRVRWVGDRPEWLDLAEAREALEGVEIEWTPAAEVPRRKLPVFPTTPDVVHVQRSALKCVAAVRESLPRARLVLDLSGDGEGHIGRRAVRDAARADVILLGSRWELRELRRRYPSLARRTVLLRGPLDLSQFAGDVQPDAVPGAPFGRDAGVGQRILFAGPYTSSGGLDMLLAATNEVRRRNEDVRLAALPYRSISPRYLAQCQRRAARLGGAALVGSSVDSREEPLWYRAADVVCLPCREAVGAGPAKFAAAAGKPFLGTEVEPLLEHVADGQTGLLIPVDDLDTLVAGIEALLGDADVAARLGAAARERAEHDFSAAAGAERLRRVWSDALSRPSSGRDAPKP